MPLTGEEPRDEQELARRAAAEPPTWRWWRPCWPATGCSGSRRSPATAAGGPVAIAVPRLGAAVVAPRDALDEGGLTRLRRYVGERTQDRPVPVPRGPAAGGADRRRRQAARAGGAARRGQAAPGPEAAELLHLAALAALTEMAIEEAREEAEQNLRGTLLEELRSRDRPGARGDRPPRAAARLRPRARRGGAVRRADDRPPAARRRDDRRRARRAHSPSRLRAAASTRCCPHSTARTARGDARLRPRAGDAPPAATAPSASRRFYADPSRPSPRDAGGRAGARRPAPIRRPGRRGHRHAAPTGCCSACWPPTRRRCAASTRTPSRRSSATTSQYRTDLVGTLEAYLEQNCNMNATAAAIYAHRHTVAYRLERVKELTGLDPMPVRGPRAPRPGPEGVPDHRARGCRGEPRGQLAAAGCRGCGSRARATAACHQPPRPVRPRRTRDARRRPNALQAVRDRRAPVFGSTARRRACRRSSTANAARAPPPASGLGLAVEAGRDAVVDGVRTGARPALTCQMNVCVDAAASAPSAQVFV